MLEAPAPPPQALEEPEPPMEQEMVLLRGRKKIDVDFWGFHREHYIDR